MKPYLESLRSASTSGCSLQHLYWLARPVLSYKLRPRSIRKLTICTSLLLPIDTKLYLLSDNVTETRDINGMLLDLFKNLS